MEALAIYRHEPGEPPSEWPEQLIWLEPGVPYSAAMLELEHRRKAWQMTAARTGDTEQLTLYRIIPLA